MREGGLERLTERERRMLRLLASGHSVKTAAAHEAITENAAHELLRSARRKLGTGSSREAARLMVAREGASQEIRDEKTGVLPDPSDAPFSRRLSKGVIAMSLTAFTVAGLFAVILQPDRSNGDRPARATGPAPFAATEAAVPPAETAAAPQVVAMRPAPGAVIAPGPFEVAITFDRPMAADSYAFSRSDEGAHPPCSGKPRLSVDGRTYALACVAEPGARYVVHLNRPPYIGFLDAVSKVPALQARLEFTVSGVAAAAEEPAEAPTVVRTVPADGAVIAPGPLTVSVTFDRPMLPDHFSFVRSDEGAYPACAGKPIQSADGRTFSLECTAAEPGTYVMYFNRPPYVAFRDAASRTPAASHRLQFTVATP